MSWISLWISFISAPKPISINAAGFERFSTLCDGDSFDEVSELLSELRPFGLTRELISQLFNLIEKTLISFTIHLTLQTATHKTVFQMTTLRNLTLLQAVINNHPEYNCVSLKCFGSGSICFNLLGNSDDNADQCFCEFPFYGSHCEYDSVGMLCVKADPRTQKVFSCPTQNTSSNTVKNIQNRLKNTKKYNDLELF